MFSLVAFLLLGGLQLGMLFLAQTRSVLDIVPLVNAQTTITAFVPVAGANALPTPAGVQGTDQFAPIGVLSNGKVVLRTMPSLLSQAQVSETLMVNLTLLYENFCLLIVLG